MQPVSIFRFCVIMENSKRKNQTRVENVMREDQFNFLHIETNLQKDYKNQEGNVLHQKFLFFV